VSPGFEHWVWDPDSSGWVVSTDIRDRDGGEDGYDCISHRGVAKNIISVGAVRKIGDIWTPVYTGPEDVKMVFYSGWGPTDDDRIKPDVVSSGEVVYSTSVFKDKPEYINAGGTSMAAPGIAGSLNLLVRYYELTHAGETPLSSTMKALLI